MNFYLFKEEEEFLLGVEKRFFYLFRDLSSWRKKFCSKDDRWSGFFSLYIYIYLFRRRGVNSGRARRVTSHVNSGRSVIGGNGPPPFPRGGDGGEKGEEPPIRGQLLNFITPCRPTSPLAPLALRVLRVREGWRGRVNVTQTTCALSLSLCLSPFSSSSSSSCSLFSVFIQSLDF